VFLENGGSIFSDNDPSFRLGYEYYKYGQDSATKGSGYSPLSSLARSTGKDIVPTFSSFRRYFEDDVNYADTMIVRS
jgi:hypothetical protein